MAAPSPNCTVNGLSTVNGVDVAAGAGLTVALASTAGVDKWALVCAGTDETLVAATVTGGLSINYGTKVATGTAPGVGTAMVFQSVVNDGKNGNGQVDPTLTTTFAIFVPTSAGLRVAALNETLEGDLAFGWVSKFNAAVREASGVAVFPTAFTTTTTSVAEAGDTGNKWSAWALTGVYGASGGTQLLYWVGDVNAGAARMRLYSDVAHTLLVAHGQLGDDLGGTITLTADGGSGLTGTVVAAASVGTDNDAANILTCSPVAKFIPYTVPDGYMASLVVSIRGVDTVGDKADSLYVADLALVAAHVGAQVGVQGPIIPADGAAMTAIDIAFAQGLVGKTIDAAGAITIAIDGRANNTVKWRWRLKSVDLALAT